MITRCFITLCIVFTMHVHKIAAEDPEKAPVNDQRLALDDMEYELDSFGDSRVPQIPLPRGKEHEYVRLPNQDGEFEVVSRMLVEESRLNGTKYDAAKYTKFLLYNRANNGKPKEFKLNEIDDLPSRYKFNPNAATVILVHGWLGNSHIHVIGPLAEEFLEKEDINVIGVNWGPGAMAAYHISRYRVESVAEYVAAMMNRLMQQIGQKPHQIGLVGHSLGAHIVGIAAKNTKDKVGYVIGLDPAAPLFRFSKKEERLAADDARYVEVIHTDAKAFGFYMNIGQVDIYPNGGISQPGCILDNICSHNRVVTYYTESLTVQNPNAHRCADVASLSNRCSLGDTFLGGYDLTKLMAKPHGVYYLATGSHHPFLKTLSIFN